MIFPLDLTNISLLFAAVAIILLVTSELIYPQLGRINILLSKKKLRNSAIVFSTLFLVTVAIRILILLLNI